MFYVVVVFRNASKIFSSIREKLDFIDHLLNLLKEKLEKSSSHLSLIADSAIKLVTYIIDKQQKKQKK